MLSAPFISGAIIAAKSRAVTYPPVQFAGATSVQAVGDEVLLEQYALLAQKLSHLPLQGELIRESKANATFPSEKSYRRFEGKDGLIRGVATFCGAKDAFADVAAMCEVWRETSAAPEKEVHSAPAEVGYVYLLQHGSKREYKIARTSNTIRREGEIDIELPHGVEPIHVITTDDAAGIENYWHRRFAAKRLKGEWFALSADDVRAFKRWRKILPACCLTTRSTRTPRRRRSRAVRSAPVSLVR
jgi:hypothetical protein